MRRQPAQAKGQLRPAPRPELLARLIADITAGYLAAEQMHGGSLDEENAAPAIELF